MTTLDQEFQRYKGQSLLVPGADKSLVGQCFMWFDFVLHDVDGLPYFYAPAAIDIWETPGVLLQNFNQLRYAPNMLILKGDIVIYGAGVGTSAGHVSVAAQNGVGTNYIGYDSNWGDSKKLQQITHDDKFNQYILGILRFKGGQGMDAEDVKEIYLASLHFTPLAKDITPWIGKSSKELTSSFLKSAQWLTQNDILLIEYPKVQAELAALQQPIQLKPGVYKV